MAAVTICSDFGIDITSRTTGVWIQLIPALCSVMSVWCLEIGMEGVFTPGKSAGATKFFFPFQGAYQQVTGYYSNYSLLSQVRYDFVGTKSSLYIWYMFDYYLPLIFL